MWSSKLVEGDEMFCGIKTERTGWESQALNRLNRFLRQEKEQEKVAVIIKPLESRELG